MFCKYLLAQIKLTDSQTKAFGKSYPTVNLKPNEHYYLEQDRRTLFTC